jgi:hypothetical protein
LLFHYTNQHHEFQLSTCQPYIRLPKMPNHYS